MTPFEIHPTRKPSIGAHESFHEPLSESIKKGSRILTSSKNARQKPRYVQSDADFEHLTIDCLNESQNEGEDSLVPKTRDIIDNVNKRDSQILNKRGHSISRKLNFDDQSVAMGESMRGSRSCKNSNNIRGGAEEQ